MTNQYWPLFDLEVRTPRLTLRYTDDDLAMRLIDIARRGIHDPGFMPFTTPWTDLSDDEMGPQTMQFHWRTRAATSPDDWDIPLTVLVDDEPVGASGLAAKQFGVLGWFETGSWLGREFHGRGLGTELRIATLHIGFVGFGARYAATGAFDDNGPSLGVTRKLGYEPNGMCPDVRRDGAGVTLRYSMSRAHFDANIRRDDIELGGIEAARRQLGIDA